MIQNYAVDVLQREMEENGCLIEKTAETLKFAKAKQKSLEEALEVLTGQPIITPESGPTLKEQILELLTPDGMGLAPVEIAAQLTESGRETGNTTVSSTLSRMKKEGVVVKRGGKWFLPSNPEVSQDTPRSPPAVPLATQNNDDSWAGGVEHNLAHSAENPTSAEVGDSRAEDAGGIFGSHQLKPVPPGTQD